MTQIYKGIPTTYDGIRFRSRLEARWAATFDILEWEWIYEPIDNNVHFHDSDYRHDALSVGWRGIGNWWTPAADLCQPHHLEAAWKEATNATQWRQQA